LNASDAEDGDGPAHLSQFAPVLNRAPAILKICHSERSRGISLLV